MHKNQNLYPQKKDDNEMKWNGKYSQYSLTYKSLAHSHQYTQLCDLAEKVCQNLKHQK